MSFRYGLCIVVALALILLSLWSTDVNANPPFLFFDGFETGDFSEWSSTSGTNLTVQSSPKRYGNYSARFGGGEESELHYVQYNFPSEQNELYFSFWYLLADDAWLEDEDHYSRHQCFLEVTGRENDNILHVGLRKNSSTTYVWSYCGIYINASHQIHNSTEFSFELNRWYRIEVYLKIDNVNGEAKMWVDGNEKIAVTGDTDDRLNIASFQIGIPFYTEGNLYSFYNYIDHVMVDILPGDINYDGTVDINDLSMIAKAYGSEPGEPNWNSDCDLNGDGITDIFDLTIIGKNYGKTS